MRTTKHTRQTAPALPRFPAGPSQFIGKTRLPEQVIGAARQAAARLNLRVSHLMELAVADVVGWRDRRTDAIREHAARHGRA